MKKFFYKLGMIGVVFSSICITSCSKDDDSLDTPKYAEYAAKYTMTDRNARYKSIELTESGNYIIIPSSYNAVASKGATLSVTSDGMVSIFSDGLSITRSDSNGIIYGEYVMVSENEFSLEGFGTIKVISEGGNAYDLDITTTDGKSIVLGANRDKLDDSSAMTDKLCRTWNLKSMTAKGWLDNEYQGSVEVTAENADEYGIANFPRSMIFTKSGTYLVTYSDGTIALSTWKWKDEDNGVLHYSWDYNSIDNPNMSGDCTVKFGGASVNIIESKEITEDGETIKIEWIINMVQA